MPFTPRGRGGGDRGGFRGRGGTPRGRGGARGEQLWLSRHLTEASLHWHSFGRFPVHVTVANASQVDSAAEEATSNPVEVDEGMRVAGEEAEAAEVEREEDDQGQREAPE